MNDRVRDSPDIGGAKHVVLANFAEPLGGVDDQHVGVRPPFLQDHDDGRDAGSEEDVGGKPDDGVDVVLLDEVLPDFPFLATPEQNAMRQHDGHDAVGLQVKQVVEQKGEVGLRFRSHSERGEARIRLLVRRIPCLRVRRVRHHRVHVERIVGADGVAILEVWPIVFQRVAVPRNDIVRQDSTHDEVHARQVVGVLLELLRVVLDVVLVVDVFRDAAADVDQQGAGAACRIVDFDFPSVLQMVRDDFGHEQGHLVRRVELASLLSGVCGEHADEVFVDEAQHVVVLPAVHRNDLDQLDEAADGLCLRAGAVAEL